MVEAGRLAGSFRDPSGFMFRRDGGFYRQVNRSYKDQYERLISSGLYDELAGSGLLIAHQEDDGEPWDPAAAYKVLKPEPIPFVSYPYEWCFGQLKDAALLTLEIQARALRRDMSLKDASAFNVQFKDGKPIFIDTLSFEPYQEGEPWVAYRQFCQHFFAPLALMAQADIRLNQLLRTNLDGVPLDLAAALLPWRSRLRIASLVHVHLHAGSQRRFAQATVRPRSGRLKRRPLLGLLDHLGSAIRGMKWDPRGTQWADYYRQSSYTDGAMDRKELLVAEFLDRVAPATVWDLGANTGRFSRVAGGMGIPTIAFDIDPACVEQNYRDVARRGETRILPLLLDLANPTPALGWQNRERMSLFERGPADAALALALIHHLAISGNLPLREIAEFFRRICTWLVIEFVPKGDPQTRRLLVVREDIFPDYTQEGFEAAFAASFAIERSERLPDGDRTIYLMRNRGIPA